MCYVITPLIELYLKRFVNSKKQLVFVSIWICGVVSVYFGAFAQYFNPAWMTCYVVGYMLGLNSVRGYIEEKKLLIFFAIFAMMGNGIQIFLDYVKYVEFPGIIGIAYGYWCNYNHTLLGVFLFLLLRYLFCYIDFSKETGFNKILNVSDKYSYEAYLVHQFVIMGPFSLMALTDYIVMNIIIVLACIALLTIVLKIIEERVLKC